MMITPDCKLIPHRMMGMMVIPPHLSGYNISSMNLSIMFCLSMISVEHENCMCIGCLVVGGGCVGKWIKEVRSGRELLASNS